MFPLNVNLTNKCASIIVHGQSIYSLCICFTFSVHTNDMLYNMFPKFTGQLWCHNISVRARPINNMHVDLGHYWFTKIFARDSWVRLSFNFGWDDSSCRSKAWSRHFDLHVTAVFSQRDSKMHVDTTNHPNRSRNSSDRKSLKSDFFTCWILLTTRDYFTCGRHKRTT